MTYSLSNNCTKNYYNRTLAVQVIVEDVVTWIFLKHSVVFDSFSGGVKYTRAGKIGDFRLKSPFISETVRDRFMVAMERE